MKPTPDACVHCGHPRDGHGTRYATITGPHTWTPEPEIRGRNHLADVMAGIPADPNGLVAHWPQEQA
ncbi:hypothetical protein ACIBSV_46970 [Embleya sp. NPDC050154]|uniref:hypothetical protein n=1 Tax=Embleya sp. NPDC050154 TaxID=3363988 RepID=UPI0037AD3700